MIFYNLLEGALKFGIVILIYEYRGLRMGDFSVTAALGVFSSVVSFVLLYVTNLLVKKFSPDAALF